MREIRLLSRAQLAAKMSAGDDGFSITPDAIAKIENGYRRPKPVTLSRLCNVLDCKPEELLLDRPASAAPTPVRIPCADCGAPEPALYGHEPGCPHAT
jgi:transcriptional regulator with XRE-family HTH domain